MKIGVFDSGLGGLTVVKSMMKSIRGADIFYIADTKNTPYGEKTPEQILQYSLDITKYFMETRQIDALIVACNTATSAAIKTLREKYPQLIIVGTEPGIKPAIELTHTYNIGVLATPATLKSDKYQQLIDTFAHNKDIMLFEQACPGLVEQIEKGSINNPKITEMLKAWLAPMRENSVDTIVLGCTHYPLVEQTIKSIMKRDLNIVHTGEAITKRVLSLGREKGYLNVGSLKLTICSTGTINKQSVNSVIDGSYDIRHIDI